MYARHTYFSPLTIQGHFRLIRCNIFGNISVMLLLCTSYIISFEAKIFHIIFVVSLSYLIDFRNLWWNKKSMEADDFIVLIEFGVVGANFSWAHVHY